jgi:hypothetical protein
MQGGFALRAGGGGNVARTLLLHFNLPNTFTRVSAFPGRLVLPLFHRLLKCRVVYRKPKNLYIGCTIYFLTLNRPNENVHTLSKVP